MKINLVDYKGMNKDILCCLKITEIGKKTVACNLIRVKQKMISSFYSKYFSTQL